MTPNVSALCLHTLENACILQYSAGLCVPQMSVRSQLVEWYVLHGLTDFLCITLINCYFLGAG